MFRGGILYEKKKKHCGPIFNKTDNHPNTFISAIAKIVSFAVDDDKWSNFSNRVRKWKV